MTCEELYEELKAALDYVGVGSRGMRDAQVSVEAGTVHIRANGRECSIAITPETSPVKESK